MNHMVQAEQNFLDAVRVMLDMQEVIRDRTSITPAEYEQYVTARLNAWITRERWRAVSSENVDRAA